jgi:calcium/calmodulin-dependent protein kinase I
MEILNSGNISEFYHIDEDLLGEGMNKVVRGLNIKTGEEVAVKIISTEEMGENDMNYLFKEIQILSEVSHPNIVKLLEVFEDSKFGNFYLVFELMKGGTLSETVAEDEFISEERAATLLLPVVDALNFCHDLGITHRDLKVKTIFYEFC